MRFTRYSAFSVHLALSLLVFSSLVAIMYFYWFPGDLFFMDGGWEGIKLVAMVDLVLGPALTLLLFKPGKPSLKMDMSIVAAIQICALAYGFHATYHQRIVGLVYSDNTFNTLTHSEYVDSSNRLLAKGIEPVDLSSFNQGYPVNVYTKPFDKVTFGEYLQSLFDDYPGIRERNDKYLAITDHHEDLREHMMSADLLTENGYLDLVKNMLTDTGRSLDTVEIYPFEARYEKGLAVFDPQEMRIVDILRHEKFSEKQTLALRKDSSEETNIGAELEGVEKMSDELENASANSDDTTVENTSENLAVTEELPE